MMKSENASADIDNEPGKPATSGPREDGVAHPQDGRRRHDRRRANCTRSRLRKVSARRIEADRFKSWTRPDRKIPGYRVRNPGSRGAYFIAVGVEGIQEA